MEFDIFVPDLALAFEYQGEHHYKAHYLSGKLKPQQNRDIAKKLACASHGITLITVEYSWKKDAQSVVEWITKQRPDISF
jgi:hypothetical protein